MRAMKPGERVLVRKWVSAPGKGLSYGPFKGVLLEYCNGEGWDVVAVERKSGKVQLVYSFCVESIQG